MSVLLATLAPHCALALLVPGTPRCDAESSRSALKPTRRGFLLALPALAVAPSTARAAAMSAFCLAAVRRVLNMYLGG